MSDSLGVKKFYLNLGQHSIQCFSNAKYPQPLNHEEKSYLMREIVRVGAAGGPGSAAQLAVFQ